MNYDPQIHHRRSIRLKGYDYSQAGAYFITICTTNRQCLFGHISNGEMILNDAGKIAVDAWMQTPDIRSNVQLDAFVVMPNHIHGIIIITNRRGESHSPGYKEVCRGELHSPGYDMDECEQAESDSSHDKSNSPDNELHLCILQQGEYNSPLRSPSNNIGAIVRGYKSSVTRQVRLLDQSIDHIWQRNYYEHIIRDEIAYKRIADYIHTNPVIWEGDKFYQ
jgi:putative transposase